MRSAVPFTVATVAALLLASSAFAVDVPIAFHKSDPGSDQFWPGGYRGPNMLGTPPAGVKLPEPTGPAPLYLILPLGASERVLMLDRKDAKDAFYNRAHFDANGNGDYSDDPVLEGTPQFSGNEASVGFEAIEATGTVDGSEQPFLFNAWVRTYDMERLKEAKLTPANVSEFLNCYVHTLCWYSGTFEANGKSYTLMLGDRNVNGRFDDTLKVATPPGGGRDALRSECDQLVLTPAGKEPSYDDVLSLTDCLMLDGQLYDLKIGLKEGKVTLTANADSLAPLTFAAEPQRILLEPKGKGKSLLLVSPGREPKVPAGEYRAVEYVLHRKDGKGSLWMLEGTATAETLFASTGGAPMVFGEPFVPFVQLPPWSIDNFQRGGSKEVSLALCIDGAGREVVTNLRRISGEATDVPLSPNDPNKPKEPLYRIVKPDGEVAAQGNFEYG